MATLAKASFISCHFSPNQEPIASNARFTLLRAFVNIVRNHMATCARASFISCHFSPNQEPIASNTKVTLLRASVNRASNHFPTPSNIDTIPAQMSEKIPLISIPNPSKNPVRNFPIAWIIFLTKSIAFCKASLICEKNPSKSPFKSAVNA